MKQGRATVEGRLDQKVEPKPRAVDPCAVFEIGTSVPYKKTELYKGRGYKAPMVGEESHPCGSQGKH